MAGAVKHDYHILPPSPWPFVGSAAATVMAIGLIGWIIIGIAVWEAWKVNRRAPFEVSGPFTLTPPVPPLPPPLPSHTATA